MAKKQDYNIEFPDQKILPINMEKEVQKSFIEYSMSVIVSRALPDARDGMKPGQRRILYAMYEDKLTYDRDFRKSATTVGNVLGRYHPHGDQAVYDSMVRLAQWFSMRYPLIEGQGNFGTIDGDKAAAYRYTESRMARMANLMLKDIEKNVVDFTPNFDNQLKEPVCLPSRFPNLLVNGSIGIAVGMATNIPPHNLGEVIDGLDYLIDNPECEVPDLIKFIKGPDFPTAGTIYGTAGIYEAYMTGKGRVKVRANAHFEEDKRGRTSIIITDLPYQVNRSVLLESMADLVKTKRIEGISDIRNESDKKKGMRIVVDLKKDANPQLVLNYLYKFTQLEDTMPINMLALVGGEPKVLNLKEILSHYLKHQEDVIVRRTRFELAKAERQAHIYEGYKKAIDLIEEVIKTIRASASVSDAKQNLMAQFGFSDVQAQAIVEMPLGRLSGMERTKIEETLNGLYAEIADYKDILANEYRVTQIIREDLEEIRAKFGDERKTKIEFVENEILMEDLIDRVRCVVAATHEGYIKRLPAETYQSQRRGGKGVIGMTRREEDFAETMFSCSTHDYIMFYTTKGKAYRLKGYEIPEGSRTSKGMNIVNLLPLEADEKVSAMIRVPKDENEEELFLCMFTRKGIIKRSALSEYKTIRKTGIIAINLDEDDELAWVKLTHGNDDILLATKKGMSIRFNENDARPIGRTARGVRAISLKEGDEVIGMDIITDDSVILTVSETGYGRRSMGSDYRVQTRGGLGLINYRTETYGEVAALRVVNDDEDIIIISSDGVIIRIPADSISIFARPSKGVRVMKVKEGERVVTLTNIEHSDEESEEAESEAEAVQTETAEENQD